MAHSAAIASDKVRADMIESIEFPHLANKYQVYGVPRTIYNETVVMEGAAPEYLFMAKLQQAAGLITEAEVEALFADAMTQVQALDETDLDDAGLGEPEE
jgi:predicted DsbA family dithiol-disulfide isomerase